MKTDKYTIRNGDKFNLAKHRPDDNGGLSKGPEVTADMNAMIAKMRKRQEMLYADNRYGVLIVLQAMDAAGKDGIVRHVMSGLNPQGVQVKSFKSPTAEELDHDYLWRIVPSLPNRGNIAIFNRSYYEDVLIVKIHNLIARQNFPDELEDESIWKRRYRQINDFERYLTENGIVVLKFFLNISAEEQRQRLLARIQKPEKHWKFSRGDIEERQHWDRYMDAYQQMIRATSTDYAPWHVIPADRKWFARLLVAEILETALEELPLAYPKLDDDALKVLEECRVILESQGEGDSNGESAGQDMS